MYITRLATIADRTQIAPLWKAFAQERVKRDSSVQIKPDFDFVEYVGQQIQKPLSFCYVVEHCLESSSAQKTIVGFLHTYAYDEAPSANRSPVFLQQHHQANPFTYRRVGTVMGLYIEEEHRRLEVINQLVEAAMQRAETLKLTDINISASVEQVSLHKLLKRLGFSQTVVQYQKHYEYSPTDNLPDLHPESIKNLPSIGQPQPLRNLKTKELVRNRDGKVAQITPTIDIQGNLLKTSQGLPIYPPPVLNPQTQEFIFKDDGELLLCPLLIDEQGQIIEKEGKVMFGSPVIELKNGESYFQRNEKGDYVFTTTIRNASFYNS